MKTRYLLMLLVLLPFMSSCDQTDDVAGIFTGKQWKLNVILYENEDIAEDYWTNETAKENSNKLLNEPNYFVLAFEGIETDGIIAGDFTGRAVNGNVSGTWTANGENQHFSSELKQSSNETDVLAKAFVNALKTAYKYKGDYNNLRIYFKEGNVNKCLLMKVNNIQN